MRHTYYDLETSAIVNLFFTEGEKMAIVSSVRVLEAKRGNGYARALMAKVLEDADREGVALYLGIEPDGTRDALTYTQLREWYERCGFEEEDENFFVRQPRSKIVT
ncbi:MULTISPECIES: GNAT family N-acetyltransferase [Streptomyces]|uniref:GNAT family N-acetyltransferase n=1 Tax=Streptomyces TaxID=1883 RepID=UPI00366092C1